MKKYFALVLGSTLSIVMAATTTFSQYGDIYKIPHGINPHSQSQIWPGFALTTGSTRKTTAMNYYGGPMIITPKIFIIWYGNWNQSNGSDNANGQTIVRDWANSIGGTPYYQLNQSLSINGYNLTGNVTYGGDTTDNYSKGTALTDSNIQSIVDSAISSNRLPYDANGVYFFMTSYYVNYISGNFTNF
jgi:hypothetical protein